MPNKKSLFDKLVKMDWQKLWEKVETGKHHTIECDDAESYMTVAASCDGDLHLWLDKGRNSCGINPSFRARTFDGGGRSERVRQALLLLAVAIIEDQEN